jgi:hypothetical protein
MEGNHMKNISRLAAISIILLGSPILAHHGSNIFVGGMMGAGIGAMAGGHDGVVPGLMTGLAFGTAAELIDNAANDHHHHHHVVYTREVHPSREYLEEQIEILEHKLYEQQERGNYLEHKISKLEHELSHKDAEIYHLQKLVKGKDSTEIIFSAKAITA